MRKVIYSLFVSLDGFINGPDRNLDWHIIDEELHSFVNSQERTIDTYLYGRKMYEIMAGFWQTADTNLSNPEYVLEYARIWKSIPKIVFSKTLNQVEGNARLVKDKIVEEITKLKGEPGQNLSLGGSNIAATFINLGLIDEYQLYIHPVILGDGTPMFQTVGSRHNLQFIETRVFGSGVVFLRYKDETVNV